MSDDEHVAIFWDYENCCPSSSMTGYDIVNNIREIAHTYGSVKLFKAYLELSEQSPKSTILRSELQSCGVSLTDCPHNGRKDVADKMMIVDMLTYALDTPAPATIVLISGDRDFVYAVSVLRLRRYRVVLVAPHSTHNSLRSQATAVLDWGTDILGKEKPASGLPTPGDQPRSGHRRAQSSVNSTLAQASPLAPKSSRRLSFRDPLQQRPTIEPLQTPAYTRSPRAPTTPLQAAWTPDGSDTPDTAGSGGSLLRPQGPTHIGLPTPSSEPSSTRLVSKIMPDETIDLGDSGPDIADLNLHLKNLSSSRTPSNSSPSPYISVTPVEESKADEQWPARVKLTGTPAIPEVPCAGPSKDAAAVPRRSSLSPVEVKALFRGGDAFPVPPVAPAQASSLSDPPSVAMAAPVAERPRTVMDMLCPASEALSDVDSASRISIRDDPSQHAPGSDGTAPVLDNIPSPVYQPPNTTRANAARTLLTTLSARSSPSSGAPSLPGSSPTSSSDPAPATALSWLEPHFANLVRAMEELHQTTAKPELLRSTVAVLLSQRHRNEYKNAGFPNFKAFSTEAEERGLVTMGGSQGYAWMKLHPDWIGQASL